MNSSVNFFRRRFLRRISLIGLGAVASLASVKGAAGEAPKIARPSYARLSIPDDWYIVGYHVNYHGRAKDPTPFVDLVTLIWRTGGCSAGFARRLMIAIATDVAEANEGIAYLNRGIEDRWLLHREYVPSGLPLVNLERNYGIIPARWPGE